MYLFDLLKQFWEENSPSHVSEEKVHFVSQYSSLYLSQTLAGAVTSPNS